MTVLYGHRVHNLGGYFKGRINLHGELINLKLATTSISQINSVIAGLEEIISFLKEEQDKVKTENPF